MRILRLNEFNTSARMYEADGFGTSPFLLKKISDVYHYFFNIEKEEDGSSMGYHLVIGKYSDKEVISGAKNSYCVLALNQLSPEIIEDIAIEKTEIPESNEEEFEATGGDVSRLMEICSKCILNYLELNPKVSRIYDEIQETLQFKGEGTYLEYMKSIVISYLGDNWRVQEGSSKNSLLISR
jgi:hypothetical protein